MTLLELKVKCLGFQAPYIILFQYLISLCFITVNIQLTHTQKVVGSRMTLAEKHSFAVGSP